MLLFSHIKSLSTSFRAQSKSTFLFQNHLPTYSINNSGDAIKGKLMSDKTYVKCAISNILREGDYTCTIEVGSNKVKVNLILDTGSSVLAIHSHKYDPSKDSYAELTKLAQSISYNSGAWSGAIIKTNIQITASKAQLDSAPIAVVDSTQGDMFGEADGILGLAYQNLDTAYLMPEQTWPQSSTPEQLTKGIKKTITPFFTQLIKQNDIANKFAFVTQRSRISHALDDPKSDPLNWGYFIMGECEQCTDLYQGEFKSIKVVHDKFYNTNLLSIQVSNTKPISIPAIEWSQQTNSNSIVDSGTNSILLAPEVFQALVTEISSNNALNKGSALSLGVAMMNELDINTWPDLTFTFEGPEGETPLTLKPDTYWQENNPAAGVAKCVLKSTGGPDVNILGLPLLNNHFTIFDRSADDGLGVIRFAALTNNAKVNKI